MEELYRSLSAVSLKLYEFLGEWCCVDPVYAPENLAEVIKAYRLLNEILSDLSEQSKLECRSYSYEELDWMDRSFVDDLNQSPLSDRWVKVGEAVSAWNALHSHLRRPPICPLLAEEDRDNSVEGIDF